MSLLPSKTHVSRDRLLFATQQQLAALSTAISTVSISTATSAGVSVSEPTANNFVFTNALSNAGGISFVSVPGSSTLGLSNAGVTGLVAGGGVSVSGATGNVTVSNTGVTQATAGGGISLNQNTGSITISNTGVISVSAGSNVSLTGTAQAPVVNATNSISSGLVVALDQYNSSPVSATTPVNGPVTTIATYGSLTAGKTYLFALCIGVNGNSVGTPGYSFDKTMSIVLTFDGIGEQYVCLTAPLANTGVVQNATCAVTIPAGQTSINVACAGFNLTGETITGTIYNSVIIPMN